MRIHDLIARVRKNPGDLPRPFFHCPSSVEFTDVQLYVHKALAFLYILALPSFRPILLLSLHFLSYILIHRSNLRDQHPAALWTNHPPCIQRSPLPKWTPSSVPINGSNSPPRSSPTWSSSPRSSPGSSTNIPCRYDFPTTEGWKAHVRVGRCRVGRRAINGPLGEMDSYQEGISPPESGCKAGVGQSGSSLDA